MIEPNAPEIVGPDGNQSSPITAACTRPEASLHDLGDAPLDRSLRAAQDARESIDGIMGPSIPERSHGAGEASPDAARFDNPDGPQSSPNIGEARDVLADDPRPLTRGQMASALAATKADRRWIDAVLGDLEGRSPATKEALAKALLEHSVTSVGHVSGLELSTRKTAKKGLSKCDKSANQSALHVSGTTFLCLGLS